jgi:hypothetical protein
MAGNSFNFQALGASAFEALARLVETCECHKLQYSDLSEAVSCLDRLAAG